MPRLDLSPQDQERLARIPVSSYVDNRVDEMLEGAELAWLDGELTR